MSLKEREKKKIFFLAVAGTYQDDCIFDFEPPLTRPTNVQVGESIVCLPDFVIIAWYSCRVV